MIWVALHLPSLSLESLAATLDREAAEQPLALLDGHAVVDANAAARALGIQPGLKRATALALAPGLLLGEADAARDAEALAAVAHAALAFTPAVSVQPPGDAVGAGHGHGAGRGTGHGAGRGAASHTVLLEVEASLRYFGGLAALLERLQAAVAPLGHRLQMVSAATPLGAALLARVHARLDCADLAATRRALEAAPVALLGPGREHWEALQGMGLHTLADLARVPRDGLARRFGEVVLSELDRAHGVRPDPRPSIGLPPSFASRLELYARADTTEPLLHGAGLLLARLVAWLSAQHAFARRFTFSMAHERRSRRDTEAPGSTALEVALAEPSRDAAHLLALLRERLAALQLPAPVLELSLHANDIARRAPPNTELFPTPATEHEGLTRLIERLQARLGPGQVMRLVPRQDHRPELRSAWQAVDARLPTHPSGICGTGRPGGPTASPRQAADGRHPVWLLDAPEPLREHASVPMLSGQPLQLLSGPERLETGWWDDALAERDYFIAQSPDGALVWIYRHRLPPADGGGWYLQGRFG